MSSFGHCWKYTILPVGNLNLCLNTSGRVYVDSDYIFVTTVSTDNKSDSLSWENCEHFIGTRTSRPAQQGGSGVGHPTLRPGGVFFLPLDRDIEHRGYIYRSVDRHSHSYS